MTDEDSAVDQLVQVLWHKVGAVVRVGGFEAVVTRVVRDGTGPPTHYFVNAAPYWGTSVASCASILVTPDRIDTE